LRNVFGFFLIIIVISCIAPKVYGKELRGKWWKNPKVVEALDLKQDQIEKIERIFYQYRDQIVNLDGALKQKEAELRKEVRNPNSRREDILRLTDEVEKIRGQLRRVEVDMLLRIRDVLTPEQRIKLHSIKEKGRRGWSD